jgi:hypothetical protein
VQFKIEAKFGRFTVNTSVLTNGAPAGKNAPDAKAAARQ